MAAVMGWGLQTLRVLDRREQTEERRSWRFELSFFQWAAHSAAVTAVPSKECLRFPICAGTSFALLGDKLGAQPGNHSRPKAPGRHRAGAGSRGLPGAPAAGTVVSGAARPHREPLPPLPSPLRPPGHPSPGRLAGTGCSHQRDPGIREPRSCRQDPTCHAPLPPPLRSAAPLLAPLRPGRTPLCMHAPRHTLTRSQLCSAGSCTAHRVCTSHRAHSARPAARTRRGDVTLGDMA